MNLVKKIIYNPRYLFIRRKLINLESNAEKYGDEEYLKRIFKLKIGKKLDLVNPITFNEKLQWLKLNDRKSKYTTMVDKHEAKKLVSSLIGENFVVREYGVFDKCEDIDLLKLPDSFVLKTTHGCGNMIIVKDKKLLDIKTIINTFSDVLKENYYYRCREWPYKNVKPRIIAEEYLKDDKQEVLPVYKFFCFNGEPFLLQAIKNDKCDDETIDYFDMEWNNLHIRQNYPNSKKPLERPKSFNLMIDLCKKMSKNIPFVRCDFYDVNGRVYFSEFTFYSDAGFERFHPNKWDKILGNKIILSKKEEN